MSRFGTPRAPARYPSLDTLRMLTLTCFGCSDQPKELHMKKALITTLIAATALTGGCASYGGGSASGDAVPISPLHPQGLQYLLKNNHLGMASIFYCQPSLHQHRYIIRRGLIGYTDLLRDICYGHSGLREG